MFVEWTDELLSEDPKVNAQHKELFNRINKLYDAANNYQELYDLKHVGDRRLKETLDFLADYVVEHFRDEEDLMLRNNYEGYERHKKMHDEFIDTINKEVANFDETGANLPNIIKLTKITAKWLVNHIMKEDLEMIKSFKIHDEA